MPEQTMAELAEMYRVSEPTIWRALATTALYAIGPRSGLHHLLLSYFRLGGALAEA